MKKQTGSSVGDHCFPTKKTKVAVSKSPGMPPPKAVISKAAKKIKAIKSEVPKEVDVVSSEPSDSSGDSDDSVHMEAATTDVVPSPTRKRKRTSKAWDEFKE
ncbi:hypothetical protein MKX03_022969, partial [Papaver bracteatum]